MRLSADDRRRAPARQEPRYSGFDASPAVRWRRHLGVLSVGPACTLPTGCTVEGPGCYASCSVYVNTLRSRLAAASLSWLATPANRTGLTTSDVLTWATAVAANDDAELFAGDPPEPIDELGPEIVWTTPAAGQVFTTGAIAIDVTATDPLGVATLGVDHVVGQTRTPIADTDPAPGHFAGTLPLTPLLAEGTLLLEAYATDRDAHPSTSPRAVEINQLSGGAISGVAVKAALASAPVTVRTFVAGAPGPIVASGTTDPSGNFTNLAIPEGTQGSLLVEVGGAGTYAEDALPATMVSITATEKLSVVLPTYTDGDTVSGLVVSPATTLAVAYLTYLQSANQGGTDLAAKWTTATGAIERHLGVTGITTVVPSVPTQVDTLDDADRYGLVLLALSRTAWNASALGGGDAGAFGSAVNAMKVLQVWVRDLSDGCLDGKAGPTTPLTYGGTTPLTDEATRLHLAQALVAYLGGPQNQTQFSAAADVLPLLDTFATGGGNTAPGACAGTNHLFDDNGQGFDREGPVVTWGAFPATDPYVRGSVTVTATAVDNLPTLPGLVFTTGQTDIDIAMNGVRAVIDTTGMNGPVPLAVRATDGSGNATPAMHDLIADNLAPAISITAPAMDGLFLRPPVTLGWSVVEANPMATTATLDTTTPVTPGFQIAAEGAHSLVVTATDRAGGMGSATRTFTIDATAPVLNVTAPASGSYVRGPVTLSWTVSDANPGTTATATLDGNPIVSGATTNFEGSHILVVNATDAAGNVAATVTRTFTVDNTPPVLTVTAISGFVRGPVTLTFSATDNFPPATITATLNGVPFSSGGQVNTEVAHTLVVNAVDQAGNAATTVTRTFTIDNTAPVLSVTAPANGSFVRGPVTLSWTVSDANPGATATATLNGNPIVSGAMVVTEGSYSLVVSGVDAAGNAAATVTRSFTVDNTPPVITITGVVDGGAYQSGVAISYAATDANPGTTLSATANGVNHNSGQSLFTAAGYTLVVNASDAAGNTATASRRFLVDSTPPNLSIRSQTPAGSYVKTPLTIIVDGTDNLQVSGVAGLAGSLAAPVSLAVTATSNGAPVTPTGGDVVNGDSSRTRTATFAGVADGPLVATFAMTDRSGNAATQRTVNVTVDNTAPTNVAVSSATAMGMVLANTTYWTREAQPTLTGTVTEAYPGATVTLLNGTNVVGSGTVTGGAWTAAFTADVPESTGFDITVRITDAAGNIGTSPVQRIARDVTGPRITSIARAFYSETNDTISYPPGGAGNRPSHAHGGVTTLLGGNASATPPATCPNIAKYAYLTAVAPQGDEPVANPLTFDWQLVDQSGPTTVGGAGVKQTSFQWRVTHVSSGVATILYDITGTEGPPGTWAVQTNLRRDSTQPVPALGAIVGGVGGVSQAREGRFDIELRAVDELGNASLVYSCMNYQPIGVPVKVATVAAASGTGVDALTGYQLTSNSTISQVLNATHPGAGLMTVSVMNPTTDPVTLTFAPSSSGRTYAENWSFLRAPSAAALSSNISCGDSITPITTGVCSEQLTGAPPTPTEVHAAGTAFGYIPQLAVRVWGPSGALAATESVAPGCDPLMAECSRFRVDIPATTQFATYNVVVGLRELRDARFATTTSGYAEASTTYWSNVGPQGPEYRTLSYTGLPTLVPFATTGDGIDRACTVMTEAPLAGQPGELSYTCTQTRRFQAIRYLASVGVGFSRVQVDATSLASASTLFAVPAVVAAQLPVAYSWNPAETSP